MPRQPRRAGILAAVKVSALLPQGCFSPCGKLGAQRGPGKKIHSHPHPSLSSLYKFSLVLRLEIRGTRATTQALVE